MESEGIIVAIKSINNWFKGMAYSDTDWLKAMIKHHEMALTMSKEAIDKSKDNYVVTLAKSIIESQSKQIDEMKKHI